MAEIFLSYAKEDRDVARKMAALLEQAGWSVWWDRRIPAGRTWRDVLEGALRDMRCMVVLWSSHSIESDWVKEEAEEARAVKKLVPVLIETVNAPVGFRTIQAADLTDWDGVNESVGSRQLIADLQSLLGKPPPATKPREESRPEHEHAGSPDSRAGESMTAAAQSYREPAGGGDFSGKPLPWKSIAAAGVALALAVGAFAFWRDEEAVKKEAAVIAAPSVPEPRPAPKLVTLELDAGNRELKPAENMKVTLRGQFSDGSESEISTAVNWSSSDSRVAAVDSAGRVTALQPGTTRITATHGGVTSSPWSLAVKAAEVKPAELKPVEAQAPPTALVSLSVNASKRQLAPQEKVPLRVTGTYSDGSKKTLSRGVIWASSNGAVASINAAGELEAWRAGKTEVRARWGEVTSAPLWLVVKEPLATVVVEAPEGKPPVYAPSQTPSYTAVEKSPEPRPVEKPAEARRVVPEQLRATIASYISRAKSYRARGDYRAALSELAAARASDPASAEVSAEIEQTKRACLAEKRLGSAGLDCG